MFAEGDANVAALFGDADDISSGSDVEGKKDGEAGEGATGEEGVSCSPSCELKRPRVVSTRRPQ